jgi:Swt1-like HEPN
MASLEEEIKLFGITNQLVEHDLDRVEREFGIELNRGHSKRLEADEQYYPQIEKAIRSEAAAMAPHYEVFYSLEKTIRSLIADTLSAASGDGWWAGQRVPGQIRAEAEKRQKKEIEAAVTPRSDLPLDFTTFGELGQIIIANWDLFGETFANQKAVEQVMARLNTLRGPIAHCSPLAEDEIVRLRLSVRDWYRLQE